MGKLYNTNANTKTHRVSPQCGLWSKHGKELKKRKTKSKEQYNTLITLPSSLELVWRTGSQPAN